MGDMSANPPSSSLTLLPSETFYFPPHTNTNKPPKNKTLKILQWNILAEQFSYRQNNFDLVSEEVLAYSYREPLILQHITNQDPDVVCLEEVDHFDSLNAALKEKGYTGFFSRKYDPEKLTTRDGIAVFYKTHTLTHINFKDGSYLDAKGERSTQGYVCVEMERREDKKRFVLFITHLKAKESAANEAVRLGQLKQLSEQIMPYRHMPVFVVGDFNTEPGHHAPEWFTAQHYLGLSSVYQHPVVVKNDVLPYSTWKIRPAGEVKRVIDFVWHTPYHTSVVCALCTPKVCVVPECRFPNSMYPSDHLSLCVEFTFNK
eukprot:GDKI01004638.1.p1 GENE.GDKI01004638.1~~GDKI01004638.1.p1  ORF type:complete len:316 (-),score=71.95 GDKI01004638.1:258-1205(-)